MQWRADSVMIERGTTLWLGGGTGPQTVAGPPNLAVLLSAHIVVN